MKHSINKLSGVTLSGWVALSALLFSFYGIGGEGYTIRIGDRLLIEQHVTLKSEVPALVLDQRYADENLSIYYSHCGLIGKGRSLSVTNNQNKVLKEWKFADAINEREPMVCKVKDILAVQRQAGNSVRLVYASKEIPGGKVLANVTFATESVVKR